jgi:aspartate aminotransferase-like enzyme
LAAKIFTPGPTEVPRSVLDSIINFKTHHRSIEFKNLYSSLKEKLRKIFFTSGHINVLTASGTGAMECAVTNFCSLSDKILFVNLGKFSKRWGDICSIYGIKADEMAVKPGTAPTVNDFKKINLNKYSVIFLTHSETSTATVTDIKSITQHIRNNSKAFMIVDAVTSAGAIEFKMDEWGIDAAVSASQKGLMCLPGLSVIAYNNAADKKIHNQEIKRYYFDLNRESSASVQDLTSWTPAIGLFNGLNTSVSILLDEGLENVWARVSKMAEYFRSEAVKIGFRLFSSAPVDSLTALIMPEDIPSSRLIDILREKYRIFIANGQGELKDKIIRVSHMGNLNMDDFQELIKILQTEILNLRK